MVNYSTMTLQQAYDRVILKTGKHRSGFNLGWSDIVMFINRAIKEITTLTLPYKDWGYNYAIAVTNGMMLPYDFVNPIRVILSATGRPPFYEARQADIREFYRVNNWHGKNAWAADLNRNPIYTIWGDANTQNPRIYLAPNNAYETGLCPNGFYYNGYTVSGYCEYNSQPLLLTLAADLIPIPYEYEDMVILSALTRVFAKTGEMELLNAMHKKLNEEKSRVVGLFKEKNRTSYKETIEYIEPAVPIVEIPPEPGEFMSKPSRRKK